jgi:hypothetical protein
VGAADVRGYARGMNPRRTLLHSLVDALPEEALDRALKFMSELEGETPLSPEETEDIERGIAACKAGHGIDGETAFARLDAILAGRRDNAA